MRASPARDTWRFGDGLQIMDKVIVTAAVTGSRATKAMNPAVPYTPEEIVQRAVDSCRAGAAIAHIHVRDPETGWVNM